MVFRKFAAVLLSAFLFTSCGGGGGGGGSSSGGGSGIRFTPDRTSVDLAYDEGTSFIPSTTVTVTATGTFSGTLYIGAIVEGQGIDPNVQAIISGQSASFTLQARSGLAAGTYTGRVQLLGCKDANCTKQIGNSPVNINYTLVVRTTLATTPLQVNVTAESGSAASSTVTVRLPTGSTSFSPSVYYGQPWLTIDQVTATTFRVNVRSLPPGTYSGAINVGAGASMVSLPVNYTVAGGVPYAAMSVAPNDLTLTGSEGAVNSPVTLTVTPPSWDPSTSVRFVRPNTEEPVPWLSATPVAGGYAIVADATDLTAGTYSAWALVSGAYPTQERLVPIALTIGIGLVMPADQLKVITAESTANTLNGTVPVNVVAGPAVNWTAESFAPWLSLTDSSGVTGETLAFQIDPDQLASLANDGSEVLGGITITPQRANMSPRTFAVRVRKNIAAVTNVGPYLQPTGRDTRLILRGRGFDAVGNLAARLQFDGGVITQITRVNDTELVVRTGPLTDGTFSFTNALGVTTASAAVKTFAPQTFTATSMPTGGRPLALFYDAERSSVYVVNYNLESLQRFRYSNQWELSSLPVPAVVGAGLSQDGSRLLVATSSSAGGRFRQLDPADMNTQLGSTDTNLPIYLSPGVIQTTNDGRSWFGLGSTFNAMAYFDAKAGTVTTVEPPISQFPRYYYGPGYTVSRDGERLMIQQSTSSIEGLLYMDAADSVVRANPANLQLNYIMSLSEDAGRFLYSNYEVRDRDFNLIGRLGLPPRPNSESQYRIFSSVLSPDGSRVYGFAYPDEFPFASSPGRVYVFDSTTRQQTTDELPILGYVETAAYPSCVPAPPSQQDCFFASTTIISPDGNTVFVAGDSNLIVVPVGNAVLTPVPSVPPAAAQKSKRGAMVPWRLDLK
jgi:hypothetical protein